MLGIRMAAIVQLLGSCAAAFLVRDFRTQLVGSPFLHGGTRAARSPYCSASLAVTSVTAAEAATLFGRLSEKSLYLDAAVGACCHSACSDCEWRLPDGGYRFDILHAARPKWVPCYILRDFRDERGSHQPQWIKALFSQPDEPINRQDFDAALQQMPFNMPMGPKGTIKAEQSDLSPATLGAFWNWLAGDAPLLTSQTMRERLQDMSLDTDRLGAIGEGPDAYEKPNNAAP